MRNEFFIERYANERHQAHLSEAALDRRRARPGHLPKSVCAASSGREQRL
jgi:hypothetical protein